MERMMMKMKGLATKLGIAAVLAAYLLVLYFCMHGLRIYKLYSASGKAGSEYATAMVDTVTDSSIKQDTANPGLQTGYQDLKVTVLSGSNKGKTVLVNNLLNYTTNFVFRPGSRLILNIDTSGSGRSHYYVYSPDRTPVTVLLILVFIVSLCAAGGKRGIKSILGILFTFTCVVFMFIPLLYRGIPPEAAAILVVAATAAVCFVLLGGFSRKTACAFIGAVAGCGISGLVCLVFQSLFAVSGYTSEESDALLAVSAHTRLDVGGLLFAAVLIGSLGAVMDVSVSIASTVSEIYGSRPDLTPLKLFKSGMNVGRDMMGAMANTLILAFAGSSLNMIILLYSYNMPLLMTLNSNYIVMEILQAVSGSMGIIFAVPAVSLISAYAVSRARPAGGRKSDAVSGTETPKIPEPAQKV